MSVKQLLPGQLPFSEGSADSENASQRENCISVSGLFKSYGELSVLSALSFFCGGRGDLLPDGALGLRQNHPVSHPHGT